MVECQLMNFRVLSSCKSQSCVGACRQMLPGLGVYKRVLYIEKSKSKRRRLQAFAVFLFNLGQRCFARKCGRLGPNKPLDYRHKDKKREPFNILRGSPISYTQLFQSGNIAAKVLFRNRL